MKNELFQWNVISNVNLEDLSVDVMYEGGLLLDLIQEEGFNLLRTRFFYPYHSPYWEIPLDGLIDVLEKSKNLLWDFRKEGTPENLKILSNAQLESCLYTSIENSSAKVFYDDLLMCCLRKTKNNRLTIELYSNPTKAQTHNVPQWNILYREFISTILDVKLKLLSHQ